MEMEERDSYLVSLGRAIRHIRTTQGLSEAAVAEAAGMDVSFIAAVESGSPDLRLSEIRAICDALSTSPSVVFAVTECIIAAD